STTAPTPLPTLPPGAQIELLGPPPDTTWVGNQPVTFYWQWPYPLANNQQFVVVIQTNGEEQRLGAVDQPNLGTGYRLQAVLPTNGELVWEVRLETKAALAPLISSERRILTIISPP
ncbi:MAG: hypothetical protein D6706_05265, partial [Chloroflexi bacterium]